MTPNPDGYGSSNKNSDSDIEPNDMPSNNILSRTTYAEAYRNYTGNQTKLEKEHVYKWFYGEKMCQDNIESESLLSDIEKKKIQKMSFVELFETFFTET